MTGEFAAFWTAYPRKVGKLAAMKEYARARTQASADEILAGVQAYIRHKPDYADWCHPRTFLAQGRWMDEYSEPVKEKRECPHTPRCHSPVWCDVMTARERGVA